jgi:predicted phosphodiesterase/biotin operon repressor
MSLDTKILKLLKQQKHTKAELAELLNVSQRDVHRTLKALEGKGVDISTRRMPQKGKVYWLSSPQDTQQYIVLSPASTEKQTHTFVVSSDWHCGSMYYDGDGLEACVNKCIEDGAEFGLHAGDIHDGYRVYRDQLSNLLEWTVEGQTDISAKSIENMGLHWYGIGGNHDYSYTRQAGIRPSKLLEHKTDFWHDLGDYAATIVVGGVEIQLVHGSGGSAYAVSYPAQKYLRNLAEGDIDSLAEILILGHFHTNLVFEIYKCVVIHPGNFLKSHDFTMRKGLRGPRGLYKVSMTTQYGKLLTYDVDFIKVPQ